MQQHMHRLCLCKLGSVQAGDRWSPKDPNNVYFINAEQLQGVFIVSVILLLLGSVLAGF